MWTVKNCPLLYNLEMKGYSYFLVSSSKESHNARTQIVLAKKEENREEDIIRNYRAGRNKDTQKIHTDIKLDHSHYL